MLNKLRAEPRGQHIGWAEPTVFDGVELGSTHLDYADVTSRYLGQNQEVLRTTPLSMLAQVVGSCSRFRSQDPQILRSQISEILRPSGGSSDLQIISCCVSL